MKKYIDKKGFVFDLDYTLYDEYLYFTAVFDYFCRSENLQEFFELMRKEFLRSRHLSKDIFRDVLNGCGLNNETNEYHDVLFNLYTSIDVTILPYKDAVEFITWCKKHGYKTGILTNGVVAAQQNKVNCLNLEPMVDNIVYARQAGNGREKPHKKSFEVMAAKMQLSGPELIFVGDNPRTDFSGAKAIGGHTIRLLRGVHIEQLDNDFIDKVIEDFGEMKLWF